jgi:hypothetical protein
MGCRQSLQDTGRGCSQSQSALYGPLQLRVRCGLQSVTRNRTARYRAACGVVIAPQHFPYHRKQITAVLVLATRDRINEVCGLGVDISLLYSPFQRLHSPMQRKQITTVLVPATQNQAAQAVLDVRCNASVRPLVESNSMIASHMFYCVWLAQRHAVSAPTMPFQHDRPKKVETIQNGSL